METREAAAQAVQTEHCETMTGECAVESVLPDYMPEIRKILRVEARVIAGGHSADAGRADFTGTVAHTVLYTDGEGKLSSVRLNGEYHVGSVAEGGNVTAFAETAVENTVCRLGGPRKISLRSSLRHTVHLLCDAELPAPRKDADTEVLTGKKSVRRIMYRDGAEWHLGDSMAVEGTTAEEIHPLHSDGVLSFREVRVGEGSVSLHGEGVIRVVAVTDEGQPMAFLRRIPFDEEIGMPGVTPEDAMLARGQVTGITVEVRDTDEGAALDLDAAVSCELFAYRKEEITPITDAYNVKYPLHIEKKNLPILRFCGAGRGFYTVTGRSEMSGDDAAESVLDAVALPTVRETSCENGKLVLSGDVRAKLILTGLPAEGRSYPTCFFHECSYPFRVVTEIPCPNGETHEDWQVEAVDVRVHLEDGACTVDTELAVQAAVTTAESGEIVSDWTAETAAPYVAERGAIRVLYPSDGETLYGVGKAEHISLASLCRANDLPETTAEEAAAPHSLDGVSYLIVR